MKSIFKIIWDIKLGADPHDEYYFNNMAEKNRKPKNFSGHICPPDPLEEVEGVIGAPGHVHDLADKPTKLPKKTRNGGRESYYPMHRKK